MTDDGSVMRRSRRRRLFLGSMLLAVLAVGLLSGYLLRVATEPAAPVAPPSVPPAAPAELPPPSAPCIAVADRGDELLAQLDRAAAAMAALDPGALRTVVGEVERLRTEMRRAAEACESQASRPPATGAAPPVDGAPSVPG